MTQYILMLSWEDRSGIMTAVVFDHPPDHFQHIHLTGIPFHHLPVKGEKATQGAQVWELVQQTHTERMLLARYMPVLPGDRAGKLTDRCINIHHSFSRGSKHTARSSASGV